MTKDSLQLAYIGIGAMGFEITQHLQRHLAASGNKPLIVHNRTLARAQVLKERAAEIQIAETLGDLTHADIVFLCLLNDAAVEQTIDALLSLGLKKDAIVVDQSTIAPELTQRLVSRVEAHGAHFVACPVMGPPYTARAAKLLILAAGPDAIVNKVLSFLVPATARKAIRVGEEQFRALQLKLSGNFFVMALLEGLSEGMALGAASGLGQEKIKELLEEMWPGTPLTIYANFICNNTYHDQIHFPLSSVRKDVVHILNYGKESNAKLHIIDLFLSHLDHVLKKHGDLDVAAACIASREEAGLNADGTRPSGSQ
ncbi:hypothetical protein BJV82DRAFT_648575 [Fennellomyces sp. T-0311]|nr:hypothetical protein BJV82DRAFT_648575 [Fennellomyces sp. T-0311]